MVRRTFNPHPIFDVVALCDFLRERDFKVIHAKTILSHLAREIVTGNYRCFDDLDRTDTGKDAEVAGRDGRERKCCDREDTSIWDSIEGLPTSLYPLLPEYFTPLSTRVVKKHTTTGGETTKLVVELQDGLQVESVIMIYDPKKGKNHSSPDGVRRGEKRATLCLSSQVGCQMGCTFCATGTMGLKGNLNPAEIFEQLVHAMRVEKIRNVVFMGMGEPLNNYSSVCESIRLMVDHQLYGLAPSRITVSTVGVTNRIKSLASDLPGVNLALSLHAPNQDVRLKIVPSSRAYPVQHLMEACHSWQEATGRSVFFEYVVLGGVNDETSHAKELGKLLINNDIKKGVVNLIPWNPTEGGAMEGFRAPTDTHLSSFQRLLREEYGLRCTIRREFGQDINSACGQLVIQQSTSCETGSASGGNNKLPDW